jgi:hypothetical protein
MQIELDVDQMEQVGIAYIKQSYEHHLTTIKESFLRLKRSSDMYSRMILPLSILWKSVKIPLYRLALALRDIWRDVYLGYLTPREKVVVACIAAFLVTFLAVRVL